MMMKPAITIRRAQAADFPTLKLVLRETFTSTWEPEVTSEAAARYLDRSVEYVEERGHLFWVAVREAAVVGLLDFHANFVHALHVRPSVARAGVGTVLMEKAEAEIAAAGFPSARLETDTFNSRSRVFYARRGYREIDEYPDQEWNSGLTTLLLEKQLA
jgi:ribosomal protein S18 acetylase RimI-like enzyme